MEIINLETLSDVQLWDIARECGQETYEDNSIVRILAVQNFGTDHAHNLLLVSHIVLMELVRRQVPSISSEDRGKNSPGYGVGYD